MAIITLQNVTIGYHGPPLLDQVDCQIHTGDRIGLLGRNGAGKSTLIKLLTGTVQPDHGRVTIQPGIRVAVLDQEVPMDLVASVGEVVAEGTCLNNQAELESWQVEHAVDQILSRMELDGDQRFEQLSAGMKRRVLLAKALVAKPEFLLLDEPTNHLDIDAIIWLEDFLRKQAVSFLFVTHDRVFLQRLANRILEIDRGQIFDWSCDYQTFLKRKEQVLAAEEKENQLFDKRLAEEEVWIRQGIKARRTRNQGRVRALKAMRDERSQRRDKLGTAKLQIQEGQKSGNLVFSMEDVFYHYPQSIENSAAQNASQNAAHPIAQEPTSIINGFSTVVMRGDKVGIVGPNGVGKSTLIKLMLGQVAPTAGSVRTGTNLEIAWFDQLRSQLNPEATVQEEVGEGNDSIQLGSSKKHILGYLQDFLFTPDRARTQIKFLSGGERNRILLAKLFAKPANLIVMDEPTNDLDAETMELLEDRLIEFSGTVLVVSHDRAFLNNLVTSTIAFEPQGIFEYVGGYDDWQRQYQQKVAAQDSTNHSDQKGVQDRGAGKREANFKYTGASKQISAPAVSSNDSVQGEPLPPARKIKYKEKIELEQLPARIETLEAEVNQLNDTICDPEFYRLPREQIVAAQESLTQKEAELAAKLERWAELDELVQ